MNITTVHNHARPNHAKLPHNCKATPPITIDGEPPRSLGLIPPCLHVKESTVKLAQHPIAIPVLSEQEPELLAELIALYGEYGETLGIIDVPADFDPLAMIVGSK